MERAFLVAVDFSELTEPTVAYAARLAAGTATRVDLLHVVSGQPAVPAMGHPAGQGILATIKQREQKTAERKLADLMERLVGEAERGQVRIGLGPPENAICEIAKQGYEMVVLSTHGRTGLQHVFLGSVAERVVRSCTIPVLVVR